MNLRILAMEIAGERDIVAVRQRAREISSLVGFNTQDQARIATAASEIARNAYVYASSGRAEFAIRSTPPSLVIDIKDWGGGIADLEQILDGNHSSASGLGGGIVNARRLMDQCNIETRVGQGTTVTLLKTLPPGITITNENINRISAQLANPSATDTFVEAQLQNKELLSVLAELRSRQDELLALTRELEDTNRGVVALYAEIEEKAEHLRRADELKSAFLSNTSHELRTPLSSIRALSQLLLDRIDGELTEQQETQVRFIQKAAADLSELVNDLLDLAKIEAGKVEVTPSEFAVNELFSTLRGMLRPLNISKSVELVFEDAAPIKNLYTDEGKVSQILRNLITNALKFTEHGEVRVTAVESSKDATICFVVSDTGIGIAEKYLQLIFEEFSQIENPLQKNVKGTGLGLPLCRKLALLLGGTIDVQSKLGLGSTFTFAIPMNLPSTGREATSRQNNAASGASNTSGERSSLLPPTA